ncbi:MAG: RadC family protein [Betaproteobacteria bacterium]
MGISSWPERERPRERLLTSGSNALSEAELLAVLIGSGVRGKSAVDLGRELMAQFKSLTALFAADLAHISGLGPAKRARFEAAMELARRALQERLAERSVLDSPGSVRDFLRLKLGGQPHEVFLCIWLDAQHRVIESQEAFRGTLTQTSVYPREVVKAALARNAAAVIFAHNHPSGVAQPSQSDELLTRNLKEALALVEVKVLDHFIVAGNHALSFAERGLL